MIYLESGKPKDFSLLSYAPPPSMELCPSSMELCFPLSGFLDAHIEIVLNYEKMPLCPPLGKLGNCNIETIPDRLIDQ